MSLFYVNIDDSYSSTGIGSTSNPYQWSQFLSNISGTNAQTDVYYLSGTRTISEDTTVSISAAQLVTLSAWGPNNEPWRIKASSNSLSFNIGGDVNIYDGMFQSQDMNFFGNDINSKTGDLTLNNCHLYVLTGTELDIYYKNNINIVNSNIYSDSFELFRVGNCIVINSILRLNDFVNAGDVNNISIRHSVLSRDYEDYTASDSMSVSNIQENWSDAVDTFGTDVDGLNQGNLHYLSASFNTITEKGDTDYVNSTWWSGTRRDGVGSLYFPPISASSIEISASQTSADTGSTISVSLSGLNVFTQQSATSATYDFGSVTSATNDGNTNHTFTSAGIYPIDCDVLSHNEWYSTDLTDLIITIGTFIVTISILKPDNTDVDGTSANPLVNLRLSAVTQGIPADRYVWDVGGNITSSTSNYITCAFSNIGLKSISVSAYSEADDPAYCGEVDLSTLYQTDTASIDIEVLNEEYYVDINSSYDSSSTHLGTAVDPFDWVEFKTLVEGTGGYSDIYRLSGSREITQSAVGSRNVLGITKNKNMIIRDWDVSACGPWVIYVKDWSVSDSNSILSAAGTTLRNGIIYNKGIGNPLKGGKIILTNTYNMFIVYEGTYSHISIDPYNSVISASAVTPSANSNIIGSTLYLSGNGWTDDFDSSEYSSQTTYDMQLQDCVITNISPSAVGEFSNTNWYIYHCTFNDSHADVTSNYNLLQDVSNQYDWNSPSDYPFTSNNDLYDQNIDFINNNKIKLRPFDNIGKPPNPGYGYDSYTNYDTGLFGYNRKDYSTSGAS